MDAETRHQLKQNELAAALGKLKNVEARKWLQTIGILVVLIGLVAGYKLWTAGREAAISRSWSELYRIDRDAPATPELDPVAKIRELIAAQPNADFQVAARLRLAKALNTRAVGDPAQHDALMREVAAALQGAPASARPQQRIALDYAMSQIHESLGEFDRAKAIYERIVANDAYRGYPAYDLSRVKLDSLDQISKPVTFIPGSRPVPATAPVDTGAPRTITEAILSNPGSLPPVPQTPPQQPSEPPPAGEPEGEAPAAPSGEAPATDAPGQAPAGEAPPAEGETPPAQPGTP
ncbi:MAG: hypothetical protein IPM64_06110 [Phycisphaerales bacterium]|nr:hypothetical protein [Phycisphaerales bacterium]